MDNNKKNALRIIQGAASHFQTPSRDDGLVLLQQAKQAREAKQAAYSWASVDLSEHGTLSQALPEYQHRPAQIKMAECVGEALTEGCNAILEAATGTGKSLGYLIPLVRSGKKAVISTANKALQDQIFYKDIPFVQEHIQQFEAALLKGRSSYICLDRLDKTMSEEQGATWDDEINHVNQLKSDEGFDGDFDSLGFSIQPELKGKIEGDKDQCAWKKCDLYQQCYIRKAKEKAARAQIVVTNHHMLLTDANIGERLLPAHDVNIIDEAHQLEGVATQIRTVEVRHTRVSSLLSHRDIKNRSSSGTYQETEEQFRYVWTFLDRYFARESKDGSGVTLKNVLQDGLTLAALIDKLANEVERNKPVEFAKDDELLDRETLKRKKLYAQLVERARKLARDIQGIFSVAHPDTLVYHLERDERTQYTYIAMTPLDVSAFLKETIFDKYVTICTSATLSTGTFDYFKSRVGERHDTTIERILPTVFDYERNALLYVPGNFPEAAYGNTDEARAYEHAIAEEMLRLVTLSRGRAFLLFSSRRMLDRVYAQIGERIPYPVLRQGDAPRPKLAKDFKRMGNAVLFGLKSFWEGVDIAGEALSLVVIDKMPFVPSDPVTEARIKQLGDNWFMSYMLPQAILSLKQGVGRLIRTDTDRGVMAILDVRLWHKFYGKHVFSSLPQAPRTSRIRDVAAFFSVEANKTA